MHRKPVGSPDVKVSSQDKPFEPHGLVSHSFVSVQGEVEQSNPAAGIHSNAPNATVPSWSFRHKYPSGLGCRYR